MGRHRAPSSKTPQRLLVGSLVGASMSVVPSVALPAIRSTVEQSTPHGLPAVVPAALLAAPVTTESAPTPTPTAAPAVTATAVPTPKAAPVTPSAAPKKVAPAVAPTTPKKAAAAPTAPLVKLSVDLSPGISGFVQAAKDMIGIPYVYGGKTGRGVDCSGLVYLALKDVGMTKTYRTSGALRSWATPISKKEARAGDLVFGPGHVGIYLGGGMMIDAPQTGSTVGIHRVYNNMTSYGRIPA